MELTRELLEQRLAQYRAEAQSHMNLAQANEGAAQAVETLLRSLDEPEPVSPEANSKEEK